jgi:hypothetical protein
MAVGAAMPIAVAVSFSFAPTSAAVGSAHHRWYVGLNDNGHVLHVAVGDRIIVKLPGGASGGFHRPHSSAPRRVRRTEARGGYPTEHRAVGRFVAVRAGKAKLAAGNDFACLDSSPPCRPPQREWSVRVKVASPETSPSARVRPGQSFVGLVNGGGKNATVTVACPGPAGGDRHGPPVSGQTLAVAPSPALSGPGFTGATATRVVAVFPADPTAQVAFHHYNHPKPIPSALRLPCDGSGVVRFVPRPRRDGDHVDRVAVQFVNIAD